MHRDAAYIAGTLLPHVTAALKVRLSACTGSRLWRYARLTAAQELFQLDELPVATLVATAADEDAV